MNRLAEQKKQKSNSFFPEGNNSSPQINAAMYKYNLHEIIPNLNCEPYNSDDEITNKKNNSFLANPQINKNKQTILEGPISKFLNKHHNLVKRYLVLNSYGFFVYKDELAFRTSPTKPNVIIPCEEIADISQREFSSQQMLKQQNNLTQ